MCARVGRGVKGGCHDGHAAVMRALISWLGANGEKMDRYRVLTGARRDTHADGRTCSTPLGISTRCCLDARRCSCVGAAPANKCARTEKDADVSRMSFTPEERHIIAAALLPFLGPQDRGKWLSEPDERHTIDLGQRAQSEHITRPEPMILAATTAWLQGHRRPGASLAAGIKPS